MQKPTLQQVDQILEKLSTDDAFRAQFQADPAGTLQQLGVTIAPGQISAAPVLASKEDIAKVRADVQASGDGEDSFIIFFLKG